VDFARAMRTLLVDEAEVTLWNDGFFVVGGAFIETLVNALPQFDFAAIVITPDDLVTSREATFLGPRDNVVFELGLFMGHLGRFRTFVFCPSDEELKLPSDLAGLTTVPYRWPRQDNNLTAALGAACDSVRTVMRKLGLAEARVAPKIREVQAEQQRQRTDIDDILRFLIEAYASEHELVHLRKLNRGSPFPFVPRDSFEDELRHLLSLGLIDRRPGSGVRSLFRDADDVGHHFEITDRGRTYLRYSTDLSRADVDEQ